MAEKIIQKYNNLIPYIEFIHYIKTILQTPLNYISISFLSFLGIFYLLGMVELRFSSKAIPTTLLLLCFFLFHNAEARNRHYKWNVKYEYRSPDCFKKLVITINGNTPGPTIQAQEGDTVVVQVNNTLLTENLSIHWHGIRQVRLNFVRQNIIKI